MHIDWQKYIGRLCIDVCGGWWWPPDSLDLGIYYQRADYGEAGVEHWFGLRLICWTISLVWSCESEVTSDGVSPRGKRYGIHGQHRDPTGG